MKGLETKQALMIWNKRPFIMINETDMTDRIGSQETDRSSIDLPRPLGDGLESLSPRRGRT